MSRSRITALAAVLVLAAIPAPTWAQETKKPNILLIMSDDVGVAHISAYTHGLVGHKTPNIDRIAKEGMMFTDYYAEQSCTAGRSAFITGIHRCATPRRRIRERLQFVDSQLTSLDGMNGVTVLRPINVLCDAAQCPTWIGGITAYKDNDHLSHEGAMLLQPMFDQIMRDAGRKPPGLE